jgi:hypothetical protein
VPTTPLTFQYSSTSGTAYSLSGERPAPTRPISFITSGDAGEGPPQDPASFIGRRMLAAHAL